MCWRKLLFIMLVEYIIGHILSGFEFEDYSAEGFYIDGYITLATHLTLDLLAC